MKSLLTHIILIFATLLPFTTAQADHRDILVVQSASIKPYDEVFNGLRDGLQSLPPSGFKSIQPATIERITLKKSDRRKLHSLLRHDPHLIVAIGGKALHLVKDAKIPVIYLLVPGPEAIINGRSKITGISMLADPARQLEILHQVFPEVKNIGVIHDPSRTGPMVKKGKRFAAKAGLNLITLAASNPKKVHSNLDALQGKINAFWMVPDLTVITPQTLESIMLFSVKNRIPVMTFAEKYLKNGAGLSVSSDLRGIGVQAGQMAKKILSGYPTQKMVPQPVRQIKVKINHKMIKKLGLKINPDFIANIRSSSGEKK